MSAIAQVFETLRQTGGKAFVPFVAAGDPDLAFTERLLQELVKRGSHICELGIPYSDPIADGPVIQAAYTRALGGGVTLDAILRMTGRIAESLSAPLVSMVSYAIVTRVGQAVYVQRARAAGIAGAIVPDLPVEEAGALADVCREHDFALIQLVAPTTSDERALEIARTSTGFVYYVSVTGITGERQEISNDLIDRVGWLRERTELPICIGFGISQPEHIRALAPVADGFIVGSAIVRRIGEAADPRDAIVADIGEFVARMVAATRG